MAIEKAKWKVEEEERVNAMRAEWEADEAKRMTAAAAKWQNETRKRSAGMQSRDNADNIMAQAKKEAEEQLRNATEEATKRHYQEQQLLAQQEAQRAESEKRRLQAQQPQKGSLGKNKKVPWLYIAAAACVGLAAIMAPKIMDVYQELDPLSMLAAEATIEPVIDTTPKPEVLVVVPMAVNIRSEPSRTAKIVGNATGDTELTVVERLGEWIKVALPGEDSGEGWVFASLLSAKTSETQ